MTIPNSTIYLWNCLSRDEKEIAFKELFLLFNTPLIQFSNMIIGCRIKAEGIVSDVFVHLLNNKKNLLAEADLITDLYKETKRLSICQLHKKRNNTSNFRNIQVEWDSLTIQSTEMSIHPEILHRVKKVVAELPSIDKFVLKLIK